MEQTLKILHRIGDGLSVVCRILLGITSLALCYAVIGQFILRWFHMSMPWASEFACYIFVWTTMLGSALASRHLMHIGVDLLINLLPAKPKKAVMILANIILLAVLVMFVVSTAIYTVQQIPHMGTTIKVSLAAFYVSLPLSGLIMAYYTIVQTLEIAAYGEPTKILLPGDEEEVTA
ncbi:MAG: TRAP transporter small permease [Lachnospiraceae bacterium]|nr:TRAP transporter small permease [Lachnospiraceae bacterium]